MRAALALSVSLVLAAACRDRSTAPPVAARPCDPLADGADPIALAQFLGAGRAADGEVYVVDRGPDGPITRVRAFILDQTTLRRAPVADSRELPSGVDVLLGDLRAPSALLRIDVADGATRRVGRLHGPLDASKKTFAIGTEGEELALLSRADVASYALVNFPHVSVQYDATTPNRERLLVFSDGPGYDQFRVFYGTDDRLVQRQVTHVDADSTLHVSFDLDGEPANAQLNGCLGTTFGPTRIDTPTRRGIPLTPAKPLDCSTFGPPDAGVRDAGPLPDAGPPDELSGAAALVNGLRFVCF